MTMEVSSDHGTKRRRWVSMMARVFIEQEQKRLSLDAVRVFFERFERLRVSAVGMAKPRAGSGPGIAMTGLCLDATGPSSGADQVLIWVPKFIFFNIMCVYIFYFFIIFKFISIKFDIKI